MASVPPSVPDRPTVPEPGDDDRTTGSRDYEGYLDILILDSGLLFDPLTDVDAEEEEEEDYGAGNILRAARELTGVIHRPNALFTEGLCVSGVIHRLIHRVIPGSKGDPGGGSSPGLNLSVPRSGSDPS